MATNLFLSLYILSLGYYYHLFIIPLSPHSTIPHQQNIYFVLSWNSRIQNSVWISLNDLSIKKSSTGNNTFSTSLNWKTVSAITATIFLNITTWQHSWKLFLLTSKIHILDSKSIRIIHMPIKLTQSQQLSHCPQFLLNFSFIPSLTSSHNLWIIFFTSDSIA